MHDPTAIGLRALIDPTLVDAESQEITGADVARDKVARSLTVMAGAGRAGAPGPGVNSR